MKTGIDKAGRLVIPKALRDAIGLEEGLVEVTLDGSGVRIEPIAGHGLADRGGRLVIPSSGEPIDDDLVRSLRDADRR
ncbi:MAG TPA: hypothetical protein VGA13_09675 [Acidimicrobiales bacterium]|jgi:AbrB family looped-hinge helix DNA binding protein